MFQELKSKMSKATIISISPAPLISDNPSIIPPRIVVPAAESESKPVTLVITDVQTWHYIPLVEGKGKKRSRFEKIDAYEHAKAVVSDHVKSVVASTSNAHPGIIAVEGSITLVPKEILLSLQNMQSAWKERVLKQADDLWNKYGQRKFISDIAVTIARREGLDKDKEWARTLVVDRKLVRECPACFAQINANALVCKECRTIIDVKAYNEKFKQAS